MPETEKAVDEVRRLTSANALLAREMETILQTAVDAIVTISDQGIIRSVNQATETLFGFSADEMLGQNVAMLMPSPYRDEHDTYLRNYDRTGVKKIIGLRREVVARRKDGSTFPVELAVSQVADQQLFTGILRDITRRKELEREVLVIAAEEQRRIGEDLHDSVCQELTALNLLIGDLPETLRINPAQGARMIDRMTNGLERSLRELRAIMRGLLPVPVDIEGLMAALSDLADRTNEEEGVTCRFNCPKPVSVSDNLTATHLYLIAQEAVHNAVKYARPKNIMISMVASEKLILRVSDDGIGMPTAGSPPPSAFGLRIMRNRAAFLGAALTFQPANPTGTVVTCSLWRKYEAQDYEEARSNPDRG